MWEMKNTSFPRVLVVGAGIAGQELVSELRKHQVPVLPVGFWEDDVSKQGEKINGTPLLGKVSDLSRLIRQKNIAEVYIAIPSASGEAMQKILDAVGDAPVRLRVVPRWLEIVQGKVDLAAVRSLSPEDLLGRPLVQGEQGKLEELFNRKTILVTGGARSIGSELVRQILVFAPKNVVVFDWWENGLYMFQRELEQRFPRADVAFVLGNAQDEVKVNRIFESFRPDFVFHAAAFKHVPLLEDFPEEAVRNNIFSTLILLQAAKKWGSERFILLSTDKAVNPKSVMGISKKIAEALTLQKWGSLKTAAVRFGNVLESFGSILPLFRQQVASGGPVTVTSASMSRYFMTIPEAVQLILHAARLMEGKDVFVLDMGNEINVLDMAKRAIRLMGYTPGREIKIQITAARPGEKMREVLLTKKEKLHQTSFAGVFRTMHQERINLAACLDVLKQCRDNPERTNEVLKQYA